MSKFSQGILRLQTNLNGDSNYFQWAKDIKNQLRSQGIINSDLNRYSQWLTTDLPQQPVNPQGNQLQEFNEKLISNELVKLLMLNNVSSSIKYSLDTSQDAKQMWLTIQNKCIPNTANLTLTLKQQLYQIKMEGTAQEFINKIEEKIIQLNEIQQNAIPDNDIIQLLLDGIPQSFKHTIKHTWMEKEPNLQNSDTMKKIITNYYLSGESTKVHTKQIETIEANFTKKFPKRKPKHFQNLQCTNCPEKNNHITSDCFKNKKKKDSNKYCKYHKTNRHSTEECRKINANKNQANTVESTPEEIQMAFTCSNDSINCRLTYDSACNVNIINNKNLLHDLKSHKSKITVANKQKMEITHTGKFKLPGTEDIVDAFYCPNSIRNLISSSSLNTIGYTATLYPDGHGTLKKGETTIFIHLQNGIWIFQENECNHINKRLELLHRRTGHLGIDNLNHLLNPKNALLKNYNLKANDVDCLHCKESNLKSKPFGQRDYTQANGLLQIIHTDLCGPTNITALGGFRYIITFTDDFSRYIVIALLKNKSDATQALVNYVNRATNLHNKQIIRVHADQGGEFVDKIWKQFCLNKGIELTYAPRKTPQLNGVAEVANRILFSKARAMLTDSSLPKELWGQAIKTAAFLKNISPTKLKQQTPYFYWHGSKPDISILRVWGSLALVHEPKTKLDNKATRGILVFNIHVSTFNNPSFPCHSPIRGNIARLAADSVMNLLVLTQ